MKADEKVAVFASRPLNCYRLLFVRAFAKRRIIMDEQYQFEFKDWEEAFKMYYRKRLGYEIFNEKGERIGRRIGNPKIVFIISTAFYSSGYWLKKPDKTPKMMPKRKFIER